MLTAFEIAKLKKLRDLVSIMQDRKKTFMEFKRFVTISDEVAAQMECAKQAWLKAEKDVYEWKV
jgi:hypothetical protein